MTNMPTRKREIENYIKEKFSKYSKEFNLNQGEKKLLFDLFNLLYTKGYRDGLKEGYDNSIEVLKRNLK